MSAVEGEARGTISTDLVRLLLASARLPDEQLTAILQLAGMDRAQLDAPHVRLPARHLAVIWSALERGAGDPDLGLHLGELRHGLPSGHVLFSVLANSPTLGQALERYCRYHDLMGDMVQPVLDRPADGADAVLRLRARAGVALHRQHVECVFSLVVALMTRLSGAPFHGAAAFAHHQPDAIGEHLRIFGPDLRFGAPEDELTLHGAYLARPITAADPELLGVLDRYAGQLLRRVRRDRTWGARVAEQLSRTLCDGKPSIRQVARQLGVSARALQARLQAEGQTYQQVLDRVRAELARAYLADERLSLAEVAFLLGFADQSAFSRAFRKWTGETPARHRRSASLTE